MTCDDTLAVKFVSCIGKYVFVFNILKYFTDISITHLIYKSIVF